MVLYEHSIVSPMVLYQHSIVSPMVLYQHVLTIFKLLPIHLQTICFGSSMLNVFFQATAREAYDRLRNETESKCKKELESTINNLKVGKLPKYFLLFFLRLLVD